MKSGRVVMLAGLMLGFGGGDPTTADPRTDSRVGVLPGGRVRSDLDVFVWPDRGVDGVYYPGDPISVLFEVTRDCYVVIYDIDTRGRLHILFPFDPWQDNFVQAGRVYEIPRDWDDFGLTVEGPPGDEFIQAVASPYPLDLPDWPIYVNSAGQYPETCADPEMVDFRAGTDRIAYLHRVNRKIVRDRWDWCATDLARFYVHPYPVRRPAHVHVGGWWDPWPDDFYSAVYIGWPVGMRIYVDGMFFGIAPCWVRGVPYGHHWIRAYDGQRLVMEKQICYRHKEWLRRDHPDYRVKGIHGREIYRSALKTRPFAVERQRPGTRRPEGSSPKGMRPPTRGRKAPMEHALPARGNAADGQVGRERGDADRKPVPPRAAERKEPADERREGKLGRLISSAGKALAESVRNSESGKQKSGEGAGHRATDKNDRREPAKAAKPERAAKSGTRR